MSSEESILLAGMIGLGIAVLGILICLVMLTLGIVNRIRSKREVEQTHEVAIIEDELHEALDDLIYPTPRVNYRHNIHCPKCGRFSKRVMGTDTVVECKVHNVQVRWKDVPVDWAYTTMHKVTVTTEPITIVSEVSILSLLTQPLDIIVPDDLRELEEMGAVI